MVTHVYRPHLLLRLGAGLFGFIASIIFVSSSILHLIPDPISGIFPHLFILAFIYFTFAATFRLRVKVDGETITNYGIVTKQTISLKQIKGYRIEAGNDSPDLYVFFTHPLANKSLSIPTNYLYDDQFINWINSLPNLDQEDILKSKSFLSSNPFYGNTPDRRLAKHNQLKIIAYFCYAALIAVTCWFFISPRPIWLIIPAILALPWITICLQLFSGNAYRFSFFTEPVELVEKVKPNLAIFLTIYIPIFLYFVQQLVNQQSSLSVMILTALALPGVVVGLLMTGLTFFISKKITWQSLIMLFIIFTIYGSGAAYLIKYLAVIR